MDGMERDGAGVIVERVNAERVVLLGWSRAILMQLAHPLIAAGVLEHSSYRGGIVQAAMRLHHTVRAMLSLNFGTPAQRGAAVARICAIHRTVHGRLREPVGRFPAGTPYSAEDPALLHWVHATLLESTATIYRQVVSPLTSDELDRYCVETAPLLHALGGDAAATPQSWEALQSYMQGVYARGDLALSPAARALGLAVLSPRAAGVPVPLGRLHTLVATGLLPDALRQAYGLPWDAARTARFSRTIRLLRALRRVSPSPVVFWPQARQRT
jgi:uncharacterized protein (DUF2236 family)